MNRREFLHITALGSAAGVLSFTGLGLLWPDDARETAPTGEATDSPTAVPPRSPTRSTDDPPSGTRRTGVDDADGPGATTEPTDAERPTSTTEPAAPTETPEPTDTAAPTEPPSSPEPATATPAPWREVESKFTPVDEGREVYVFVENGNDYAVEVVVTVSWDFEDGSEAEETRTVRLDAGGYWNESLYADANGRTVDGWGRRLSVRRPNEGTPAESGFER